ncbi:MAG: hypothetical protein WCO00_15430 [Rhodospirillaceae bacterium]
MRILYALALLLSLATSANAAETTKYVSAGSVVPKPQCSAAEKAEIFVAPRSFAIKAFRRPVGVTVYPVDTHVSTKADEGADAWTVHMVTTTIANNPVTGKPETTEVIDKIPGTVYVTVRCANQASSQL